MREVLDRDDAVVTSLWFLEVASGLRNGERRGRISEADVYRRVDQILAMRILPIELANDRALREVMSLAREYRLSVYDAAYLDLAIQQGLPIATLDDGLLAAIPRVGVPLFDPR